MVNRMVQISSSCRNSLISYNCFIKRLWLIFPIIAGYIDYEYFIIWNLKKVKLCQVFTDPVTYFTYRIDFLTLLSSVIIPLELAEI